VKTDLSGQVAVVTGVLGRLGTVWTGALLGAGARVVGLDLPGAGEPCPNISFIPADVTDPASLREALATCLRVAGPPTVLVNNAGIDRPPSSNGNSTRFCQYSDEESARVLDVNAHGALRMCQVFGGEMAGQGTGSIINIGSLYGSQAPDHRLYDHLPVDPPFLKPPAYGMSKAGLAALTRYLAALWGPHGVRVNTLSPGGVLGDQDAQFRTKFSARVPLRRLAETGDLVGPLLFLASDASRYVTGTELLVDGGYACW
jgi:NAD(P)-dependent dehydrogenase (short-subunit alcohol dehydrogenase family)